MPSTANAKPAAQASTTAVDRILLIAFLPFAFLFRRRIVRLLRAPRQVGPARFRGLILIARPVLGVALFAQGDLPTIDTIAAQSRAEERDAQDPSYRHQDQEPGEAGEVL